MSAPTFAQKLREWREAKRWTRAAAVEFLSGELNVPVSLRTYEDWEVGRREAHSIIKVAIERAMEANS